MTDSMSPETGRVQAGAENRVDDDRAVADLREMQLPGLAVADFDDGHAEASENLEIDSGIAAHVGDAAHQEDRHADAALHQRAGDDKAVAAVVAVAAEHRHLALEQLAVHGFHGGDDLTAGVFHQDERRDADLVDRPPIGLAHLCGVQDAHRIGFSASSTQGTQKDTSLRASEVAHGRRRCYRRRPACDSQTALPTATFRATGSVRQMGARKCRKRLLIV